MDEQFPHPGKVLPSLEETISAGSAVVGSGKVADGVATLLSQAQVFVELLERVALRDLPAGGGIWEAGHLITTST